MDYYNLLGIEESASSEEIKLAYEKQVNKYREEIKDEKRAKLFIKAFDEAYEALMKIHDGVQVEQEVNLKECAQTEQSMCFKNSIQTNEGVNFQENKEHGQAFNSKENGQLEPGPISSTAGELQQITTRDINRNETVVMTSQEIQQEYEIQRRVNTNIVKSEDKSKRKSNSNTSKKKKSKSKKTTAKGSERDKEDQDKRKEKIKRKIVVKENKNSTARTVMSILILPLKILALPIIALLSVIIFICKIINIVSWIASKVIIVGAIGGGAIYLYEVYHGRQLMNNKLIVLLIVAIIASYFLPHILRFILKIFGSLNDALKNFVF